MFLLGVPLAELATPPAAGRFSFGEEIFYFFASPGQEPASPPGEYRAERRAPHQRLIEQALRLQDCGWRWSDRSAVGLCLRCRLSGLNR